MAGTDKRRGAICYNVQHMYTLKENSIDKYLKLHAGGDIVKCVGFCFDAFTNRCGNCP
jgi:hypothetical protein